MNHMQRRPWFMGSLILTLVFTSSFARAQYTANFQTNTINGVSSNWPGLYLVGYTNSSDALLIVNGGAFFSSSSFVGGFTGGPVLTGNNSALVSGSGSAWTGNSFFCLGFSAPGNTMTVTDGATVSGYFSVIGYQTTSSNNALLITGAGSTWSNTSITVGYLASGNSLTIANGARELGLSGAIGDGAAGSSASNNMTTVTGTGSQWSETGSIAVGITSGNNTLLVSAGAHVVAGSGFIGAQSGQGNATVVTDPLSAWDNTGSFSVGQLSSSGSSLVVSNGARVSDVDGFVGGPDGLGFGNNALVTGIGSVWSNSDALVVGETRGSVIGVAPGSLVIGNGGMAISPSGVIGESSSSNVVWVTDAGSAWNNTGTLTIGDTAGGGNSLVITNGGGVVDSTAYVGRNSGSNNVSILAGGVWSNVSLYVGYGGPANAVQVANGSVLATNLLIGLAAGPCNNSLQVHNGGLAIVTNAAHNAVLEVRGGQLLVDGGVVQTDNLVITNSCASLVHTGGTLLAGNVVLNPNLFQITSVSPQSNDMVVTWMMGPGATNALQATTGDASGNYNTNGFTDIFIVTNNPTLGTVTNYLDAGAATNTATRYYRARLGL
ncbi:MAG TPA: hypothetical protein VMP11_12545 [Verrucomicrobiae bacterium]|nr:hypothetical protein [Verrucomicrobiae bacterium]